MRKLASIRTIHEINPITGADKIEVAQIDGWECVVKKGEFQKGQLVVYIEVDSVLPERPEFEFLRDRKFRVRTIKLRGQVSQGLVLPLSVLPKGTYQEGMDVTNLLGITKYDPQVQEEQALMSVQNKKANGFLKKILFRFRWYRNHFCKSNRKYGFPEWIVKTDETRIQNMPVLFETESRKGTVFSVTEKMDGQSATYFLKRVSKRKFEFGVCSRNLYLPTQNESSYWQVAKKYQIESALKKLIGTHDFIVLQGEICGTGIQGNKYQIDGYELFVFNLIYPDHRCSTSEIQELIFPLGMKTVPLIMESKRLPSTIQELVEYSKGESVVKKGQKREGVVMRNEKRNISFKVINPDFLLSEK